MRSAREVALHTISAVEQKDAWANAQLKKELQRAKLDRRDAAFATRLTFGTIQNKILLDYYLGVFSKIKPQKMEAKVRDNLRIALYQLLFMDRVPPRAAVDEAVKLTRKYSRNPRASGMVNGILRNILRNIDQLPTLQEEDEKETLALRYSHPRWLVDEFSRYLSGEELEKLLALHNEEASTVVQINTVHFDEVETTALLEEDESQGRRHPWLPGCFILDATGNLEESKAFLRGAIYAQDPAAKMAVLAAGPKIGSKILDACAAPGGKSFAAAIQIKNQGEILSCDRYPHKETLIQMGSARMGLSSIQTAVMDATERQTKMDETFDLVIADVPCSGLGVIRKKPEIRYKDPRLMQELPDLQGKILSCVSYYLKPGGVLLYATCTLRREENEDVVLNFLNKNTEFHLESFSLPGPVGQRNEGMLTLWPQRSDTDGFFIAKMRKEI